MLVLSTAPWKVALALVLLGAMVAATRAGAPQAALAAGDVRRLVLCALALYGVGALAWLTHHPSLAAVIYAAGIMLAALASWYSRGGEADDPPSETEPDGEQPPPDPDGLRVDWASFERDLRAYADRALSR